MAQSAPPIHLGRLARWRHALSTVNPPAGELDPVSRWLVITRAGVLPMTLTAGAVAGLLSVRRPGFAAAWYALAFIGIVLAHISNNLVNDLFDTDTGLDTGDYPRALYAPHPILSGMIARAGLIRAAVAVNLAGKHIDKLPWDRAAGIRTLPVILGEPPARTLTAALPSCSHTHTPAGALLVAGLAVAAIFGIGPAWLR